MVLVHVVPEQLTFEDLKAMPEGQETPTLLAGNALQLSLAGATSGSNAVVEADIDACAKNSSMHTIRALLPIANLELPESAAPRTVQARACFHVLCCLSKVVVHWSV